MAATLSAVKLRDDAAGLQVDVQVQPRAGRTTIAGMVGDRLKVAIAAPPVDGAANAALVAALAEAFQAARSAVTILRGHRGRKKTVRIAGRRAADLATLLARRC